ncbi:unnamed protein product, partial [Brachionus calyciflorus]
MEYEILESDQERRKLEEAISREFYLSIKKAQNDDNLIRFEFGLCRICSDEATGIHFGVSTCEPCKVFFRRSLLRYKTYVCRDNNLSCKIYPRKTKKCQLCRWNACLKAGMSVNGIRMGRIPNSMKNLHKSIKPESTEENSDIKKFTRLNEFGYFEWTRRQNYADLYFFLDEDILLNRELYTKVMGQEIANFLFEFYQSVKDLNLTNQEYGLLVAFLFSSQDSDLDNPNLLNEINEYYLQALVYEFKINKRSIEFVNKFLR